jgi:hypothetical protein
MMKKLLFSALFIFAVAVTASAQCTPGPETIPGIYPDTTINLPTAFVNLPYTATITVVVPVDTTVGGFVLPIDSIGVIGWSGNPTGFIYTPNTVSGYWAGGTKGCVLISGTAAIADTGLYHLIFNVKAYVLGSPTTYTANGYKILVKDTALGVQENSLAEFSLLQNSPNPFAYQTKIEFTSPSTGTVNFAVANVIGEEVYTRTINAVRGENSFDFFVNDLPSGIYIYKLSNTRSTITKRMIIER